MALAALTAVGALALAAPGGAAPRAQVPRSESEPVLFVANSVGGTVTLIDAHSLTVLGTFNVIPDGNTPRDPVQAAAYPAIVARQGVDYAQGIAVSPDGRTLYVSRGYLGDTVAFDLASGRMLWRTQIPGLRSDHVALSPDGSRLFVSALTANQVEALDAATGAIAGSFPAGDWPHVLETSPDGQLVYNGSLGNQLAPQGLDGNKQLTVADAHSLTVLRTYKFDAGVRPFVIDRDGHTAFVQLSFFNGFEQLDLQTGQVVRRVDLPVSGPGAHMAPKDYPNQAAHHGIALSLDGRYVCDAATISNYVALVRRPALSGSAIIPVGDQPAEAETSLDGRYCFVTNRGPGANANSLSVISYAQRREVARIPVGEHPMEEQDAMVPVGVLRAGGYLHAGSAPGAAPAPPGGGSSRGARCTSRRVFTVHLRGARGRPLSLAVYIGGRRAFSVRGRTAVRVNLRGRSGLVRVALVARLRQGGRTIVRRDVRIYHLCRAGRHGPRRARRAGRQ